MLSEYILTEPAPRKFRGKFQYANIRSTAHIVRKCIEIKLSIQHQYVDHIAFDCIEP